MNPMTYLTAAFVCAVAVATPAAQTSSGKTTEQQVTVSGCVEKEVDYRRAHDKGRAGVAGTGIGAGDEFVLTNVKTTDGTRAYELTGPNEKQLAAHLGHRVELTGRLKSAEVDASGKPTGGATAGKPPTGVDVVSKDLKLRELDISSIKMVSRTEVICREMWQFVYPHTPVRAQADGAMLWTSENEQLTIAAHGLQFLCA
jgi:hypothetical protein